MWDSERWLGHRTTSTVTSCSYSVTRTRFRCLDHLPPLPPLSPQPLPEGLLRSSGASRSHCLSRGNYSRSRTLRGLSRTPRRNRPVSSPIKISSPKESTTATLCDNSPDVFRSRKGSTATLEALACLLRLTTPRSRTFPRWSTGWLTTAHACGT